MDSQSLPVLTAAASFVTGVLLCWLVMRGRISAAAAQAKPEVQTELTLAKEERGRTLEARLLTLQDQEKASQQALLLMSASDAENTESLKSVFARLVELEDENAALKRDVAPISSTPQAPNERPATLDAEVTQLPVLEAEVLALQRLAKTIQLEFQLLAELQRNFTLTSTTIQEFS